MIQIAGFETLPVLTSHNLYMLIARGEAIDFALNLRFAAVVEDIDPVVLVVEARARQGARFNEIVARRIQHRDRRVGCARRVFYVALQATD